MTVLAVNGINVGAIIAAANEPKGERRNIGAEILAADGSWRTTRQTRKRDVKFTTIPLTKDDAFVWESFFVGEGEVWSFNTSLYGSKGLPASANVGCTIASGSPKFGAAKLIVPATTGSIAFAAGPNLYGSFNNWMLSVWRSTDSGSTWTNYIINGTSTTQLQKWVDGVRNDAATTTWLTMSSTGTATIANTSGSAVWYDDLVILPFSVPTTWPPVWGVRTTAFPSLPYLELSGDLVPEQPLRTVLGEANEATLKIAGSGGALKQRLEVEFKAR